MLYVTQITELDNNCCQRSNDILCVSVRLFDASGSFRGHQYVGLKLEGLGQCSRVIPPLLLIIVRLP